MPDLSNANDRRHLIQFSVCAYEDDFRDEYLSADRFKNAVVVATRGDGPLAAAGIPASELQLRAMVDEGKVEGGSLTVGCVGAVRSAAADGSAFSPHRAAPVQTRSRNSLHFCVDSSSCSLRRLFSARSSA